MKKSVLITGAVRNTGFDIAEVFAKNGYHVFVASRQKEDAVITAQKLTDAYGVECFGVRLDPGDLSCIEPTFQEIKNSGYVLDTVVLNAASQGLEHDPLTVNMEDWASVLQTNVIGGFLCARASANAMIQAHKKGTIVFVGSIVYRNAIKHRSAYIASKGAILSLTKALAVDLGEYGIRVNCLIAGPIYTDRYDRISEDERQKRNNAIPIGAVSTGRDIAGGVFFLATEASGNATGSGLVIDGGIDSCLNRTGF